MSLIFALDSSGKTASTCITQGENTLYSELVAEGLTHSETLLPLIERSFSAVKLTPQDIDAFAVAAGPGSFTGLRIGLSLAKGLCFAHTTPLVPLSTLEAMALATQKKGVIVPALDARRGEVYWAAFHIADRCERLVPDTASPAKEALQFIQAQDEPVILVGDGARLCYTECDCNHEVLVESSPLPIACGAATGAAQLLRAGAKAVAEQAVPVYLRLSQAERERLAKKD